MNYPMRRALIDAVSGRIDVEEFDARLMSIKENYPAPAYYSLLNIITSHDVERIMTRMGDAPSRHEISKDFQASFKLDGYALELAKEKATLVVGLQMMLPGVPCIYSVTKSVCRDMAIRSAVRHIHGIMLTKLTRTEE